MDDQGQPHSGMHYKTLPFHVQPSTDLEPGCFAGYVASFASVDSAGEIILPGAFAGTLPAFLADGFVAWQHDWQAPIGKPIEAREDQSGLFIKARISDTSVGRDALTLLRDGVVKKLSIGYQPLETKTLTESEGHAILGPDGYQAALKGLPWYMESIRALVRIKLWEGSLVSVPANENARILAVKDQHGSLATLEGLTMAEQYEALLLAERDYLTRFKELASLRAKKEGRVLSEGNRSKLATMRDSLQTHITTIDDLLVSSERASGAPDGESDGKTHADPALVLAARAQLIRFQHLEAHLHGAL